MGMWSACTRTSWALFVYRKRYHMPKFCKLTKIVLIFSWADFCAFVLSTVLFLICPWRLAAKPLRSKVYQIFLSSFTSDIYDASVPDDHSTIIAFHGTSSAAATEIERSGFRRSSKGMLGAGVYISRHFEKVRHYALRHNTHGSILRLRVNVGRVVIIDHQDHKSQGSWQYEGFHSAWVPAGCGMVPSGLE